MTNTIGIVWSSDSRAIIEDFQKRNALLEKEIAKLKELSQAGKTGGKSLHEGFREATGELSRLGKSIQQAFKPAVNPLDAHLERMKQIRVAYRMGKIDADQFAKASQASLKQRLIDSGMGDRLKDRRAAAREKADQDRQLAEKQAHDQRMAEVDKRRADREEKRRKAEIDKARSARSAALNQEILQRRQAADRVKQMVKSTEQVAFESYQHSMEALRSMRATGEITVEEFRKAWTLQKQMYQDAIGLTARRQAVERDGVKVTEQARTAQERHNAAIARLRALLRAGAIDLTTFKRAASEANMTIIQKTQSVQSMGAGLGAWAGRVAGVTAAYMALRSALQMIQEETRKQIQLSSDAIAKQEDLIARFRAQAGIKDVQEGRWAKQSIYRTALSTATTSQDAFGAATAMASTGFESKEAMGPALKPFLKFMKAQSTDPSRSVSANELAESFSQFMSGAGMEKTGENVEKLAVAVQGLKETPLKIPDLAQLAKHSSALKNLGNMSWEEMVSNYSYLRNTEDPEAAGTHLREIVRQLSTAGGNKKATEQLGMMGMRPEDVDFIGEDFATVMQRMRAGLGKLSPEQRNIAKDILVEGRNISAFDTISQNQNEVAKLRGKMADKAGFDSDYEIVANNKVGEGIRLDTQNEWLDASLDMNAANDRKRLERALKGKSPAVRAATMKLYDMQENTAGHESVLKTALPKEEFEARMLEQDKEFSSVKEQIRQYKEERQKEEDRRREQEKPQRPPVDRRQSSVAPAPVNVSVNVIMPGSGERPGKVPASRLSNIG